MGHDFSFDENILPDALIDAGFVSVRTKNIIDEILSPHGIVDVHFARKSVTDVL
jgi:hypothetical protein